MGTRWRSRRAPCTIAVVNVRVRITCALVAMLAASVRCSGPVDPAPLQRFDTCSDLQLYLEDQILHPGVEADTGSSGLTGCSEAQLTTPKGRGPPGATEVTSTTTD